jgi:hypothetical protein
VIDRPSSRSVATDSLATDERAVFVRMLAAAALTQALKEISTENHERPAEHAATPIGLTRRRA